MASQGEKKQKILAVILVTSILAMAIVLIWSFSGSKTSSQPSKVDNKDLGTDLPFSSEEGKILPTGELVSTELDLSILESAQFKDLRSHGDLPVKAGQTGRSNPFLPY